MTRRERNLKMEDDATTVRSENYGVITRYFPEHDDVINTSREIRNSNTLNVACASSDDNLQHEHHLKIDHVKIRGLYFRLYRCCSNNKNRSIWIYVNRETQKL